MEDLNVIRNRLLSRGEDDLAAAVEQVTAKGGGGGLQPHGKDAHKLADNYVAPQKHVRTFGTLAKSHMHPRALTYKDVIARSSQLRKLNIPHKITKQAEYFMNRSDSLERSSKGKFKVGGVYRDCDTYRLHVPPEHYGKLNQLMDFGKIVL